METDYFYFINAIRAREKKGVAVTDVTAFDQLDGVVVNQDTQKLQQGWFVVLYYPPASEASREVVNLTEIKIMHTPVLGVKEFVCLSVCLSVCL